MKKYMNLVAIIHLMRLHRPIGAVFLMLPCWWGLALKGCLDISLYGLFALGAITMRGFGCVINDYFDKDFDKHVSRTKNRPLAAGVAKKYDVIVALLVCGLGGLFVFLHLNLHAMAVSFIALVMATIYPLMKRITNWPQLWLGFVFNSGLIVAFLQTGGDFFSKEMWLLYVVGILWTLAYDTIYAFQDKDEDAILGLGSTAIVASFRPKLFIGIVYGLLGLFLYYFCIVYGVDHIGFAMYAFILLMMGHWLFSWNPKNPGSCQLLFKKHKTFGLMVFLLVLLGKR